MEEKNQCVSSSLPEEEKDMLDLNKVPSISDPSSAADSDYLLALGNAGNTTSESSLLVCGNNAGSRDDASAVVSDFRDDAGTVASADVIFPNSDLTHEGKLKSQPSGCCGDDAGLVGGNQCASGDRQRKANDASKGRRGRKKKVVHSPQSPKATELTSERELIHVKGNEANKERRGRKRKGVETPSSDRPMVMKSEELINVQDSDGHKEQRGRERNVADTTSLDKDLKTMPAKGLIHVVARKGQRGRKRKAVESDSCNRDTETLQATSEEKSSCLESQVLEKDRESSESNVAERSEDVDMGGEFSIVEVGDADHNSKEDVQKFSSRPRGRKRKVKEDLSGREDNEIIDKKAVTFVPADMHATVGRVLRSRTLVEAGSEQQAYAKEKAGSARIKDEKEGEEPDGKDIDIKIDVSAPFTRSTKNLKKRRGRPPKLHKEKGNAKVCVKKKIKLETQKFIKKPKSTKGSNSLKVQSRNASSAQEDDEKEKTKECKESNNQLAAKGEKCAGDRCQNNLEGRPHHSGKSNKALNKTNGALRRSEEKQLVRDQIVSILKNAGWTIQYRPRMSKEYLDAVYVDCEGKTYWSVTLAYKTLRARVENGTADTKAVAAFIPIPEEKLSTLFRITKMKRGDGKQKEKVNKAKKKIGKEDLKKPSLKRGRPRLNRRPETKKRCALLARRSENGLGPNRDGFILYEGKRTLLSWMIDSGTLSPGAKVQLTKRRKKNATLEGKITREGICCGCCDANVTLSVFQSHADYKLEQPFDSIYLDSGRSLSQCLTGAWRKHVETNHIGFHFVDVDGDDPNDDTCNLCGDGGDLICCDGCPSTFHQSCLRIQKFPSGDWRCVYCSCKFCGMIDRPCLSDDVEDTDDFSLLTCLLCEEKFHVACIQERDVVDNTKKGPLFCGRECQKIFERLQKVLGVRHELEDGFSWTILRCQDVDSNENCSPDSAKVVGNCKLVLAFSIMDECFSPIIDPRSQTNMIQRVVFSCGSNFRRLNYSGFCTIILERGEEIVAAAAIRIHGNQLAEMPFIGTRYMYRRQGMCRRLLSAIEMALSSFDVEKLVIPAVSELNETWTNVFGFAPLEESRRQDMNYMSMVVFPGTDMLQKPLGKDEITAANVTCASETSHEVVVLDAPLKDEKIQDVDTPQSSITPPHYSSEVVMQQLPKIMSSVASKCTLELNRDCVAECRSFADTMMGPQ